MLGAPVDGWDDSDGYYQMRAGEMLNDRFRVVELCGKGMFSVVLRAVDTHHPSGRMVAVKMVRGVDRVCACGCCALPCVWGNLPVGRGW